MKEPRETLVLVTGASAGIGRATARAFARKGFRIAICARRLDLLRGLETELENLGAPEIRSGRVDVRDRDSIRTFVKELAGTSGIPDILVNNAGLARGTEKIEEAGGEAWTEMIETNFFGVLWMTRELLPGMVGNGGGTIVMVGSVAGRHAYAGGSVYCATKRALQSICRSLRLETLGRNIRVCRVDPGLTETEFSLVRFSGDQDRADRVYEGVRPLEAEDIAECILFVATRPPHVNIEDILVMPTIQADPYHLHREEG